jgi:hypothetical protein
MAETETDDDGIPGSDLVHDLGVEEQTCRQLRATISAKTGHRPPASMVTKPILNSVHAYLTGEFYEDPGAIRPYHISRNELTEAVLTECLDVIEETPRLDGYEEGLKDLRDKAATADKVVRSLNKSELQALVYCMNERGDQRSWTRATDD